MARVPDLPEWIDPAQKAQAGWPDWAEAVRAAHTPQDMGDLSPTHPARERLAYDEFMAHQMTLALARAKLRRGKGRATVGTGDLQAKVLEALPYQLTGAQTRAIAEIAEDMAEVAPDEPFASGRCGRGQDACGLEGAIDRRGGGRAGGDDGADRNSGAAAFAGLDPLAEAAGVVIEILTGRDKGAERRAKLEALKRAISRSLWAPMRCFRRMWNLPICGWPLSMSSIGSACGSGWSWARRGRRPMFW